MQSISRAFFERSIILDTGREIRQSVGLPTRGSTVDGKEKGLRAVLNGGPGGKHRAYVGPWHRLRLAIGRMFQNQQRRCRTGQHDHADPTPIGGGIIRHACTACGAVSLDLREATKPSPTQLFKKTGELQTFALLRRQFVRRF